MEKKKNVTIDETKNTYLITYTWLFAHKQARMGKWHEYAVDRERFKRRIKMEFEPKLAIIFQRNLVSSFPTPHV